METLHQIKKLNLSDYQLGETLGTGIIINYYINKQIKVLSVESESQKTN